MQKLNQQADYSLDKLKKIAGHLIELIGQELFEEMPGCVSGEKRFAKSAQRRSFYKYCIALQEHKGDL